MKVERIKQKVFEPVVVTLETQKEVQCMITIANVLVKETLEECCKRNDADFHEVNSFGCDLGSDLTEFSDR